MIDRLRHAPLACAIRCAAGEGREPSYFEAMPVVGGGARVVRLRRRSTKMQDRVARPREVPSTVTSAVGRTTVYRVRVR